MYTGSLGCVLRLPQELGREEIGEAMLSYKLAQDEKLLAQVIVDDLYG